MLGMRGPVVTSPSVSALSQASRYDKDINVRLAAIDALGKIGKDAKSAIGNLQLTFSQDSESSPRWSPAR